MRIVPILLLPFVSLADCPPTAFTAAGDGMDNHYARYAPCGSTYFDDVLTSDEWITFFDFPYCGDEPCEDFGWSATVIDPEPLHEDTILNEPFTWRAAAVLDVNGSHECWECETALWECLLPVEWWVKYRSTKGSSLVGSGTAVYSRNPVVAIQDNDYCGSVVTTDGVETFTLIADSVGIYPAMQLHGDDHWYVDEVVPKTKPYCYVDKALGDVVFSDYGIFQVSTISVCWGN